MTHTIIETVERASDQFQQNSSDYVARCSCGWEHKTRMGRGLKAQHQSAIHLHKLRDTAEPGSPYGRWCRKPEACAGKGYCPLDPTCGD